MNRSKSEQEVSKPSGLAKTTLAYWMARVFVPTYQKDGKVKDARFYAVQLQAAGERRKVSLGTPKKKEAAQKALKLYETAKSHGWDKALAELRGESGLKKSNLTIGEFFDYIRTTDLYQDPRTLKNYESKFRRLAGDIGKVKLRTGQSKANHLKGGGAEEWRKKVEALPLSLLTEERLLAWRRAFLNPHVDDPTKLTSAKRTANTLFRCARALFKKKALKRYEKDGIELPQPVPFLGIDLLEVRSNRYVSEISSPEALFAAAHRDLHQATPESEWESQWKANNATGTPPLPTKEELRIATASANRKQQAFRVFVLGIAAGLRRDEIDKLQWAKQVDLEAGIIRVIETDCFSPKADSVGEIKLDSELVELLKEWKVASSSRFVVDGVEPSSDRSKLHYRADKVHEELIRWLRLKGITSSSPIHTLRKEFGSIINRKAGIHVASRLLRHSSIGITSDIYVDDGATVTAGFGKSI